MSSDEEPKVGDAGWKPAWLRNESQRLKPLTESVALASEVTAAHSKPAGIDRTIPSVAGKGYSPFEEGARLGILPTATIDSAETQRALDLQREKLKAEQKKKHVDAASDASLSPRPGPGDAQIRSRLT